MSERNVASVNLKVRHFVPTAAGKLYADFVVENGALKIRGVLPVSELGDADGKSLSAWLSNNDQPVVLASKRKALLISLDRELNNAHERRSKDSLVVDQRGWNGNCFVSNYSVIKPKGSRVFVASNVGLASGNHLEAVTLKRVKNLYRELGAKNPLVRFVVCAAFVGPLLRIMGRSEQPWFMLYGEPACGKSSLLRVAASPWGGTDDGAALGYLQSLSGTENGLEDVSAKHRDMLVAFDDTQQIPEKERAASIRNLLFRVITGRKKARRGEEVEKGWRNVTMLASNYSLVETFQRAGMSFDQALLGRVLELPCNGQNGVLDYVPSAEAPNVFIDRMKREADAVRGVAGDAFLYCLVDDLSNEPERLRKRLERWKLKATSALGLSGHNGHEVRVAETFALAYVAGRLLAEYGITGWSEARVMSAVKIAFKRHRAFVQSELDKVDPLQSLIRFIRAHKKNFATVQEGNFQSGRNAIEHAPGIKYVTKKGEVEYCFLPRQIGAILPVGIAKGEAIRQLRASRHAKLDGGNAPKRKLAADWRPRLFVINAAVLSSAK